LSAERFKAVIDTNFYGVVNVTRAAVPHMRKQRSGCILQISSVGGRLTRPGSTPYHAAKWAVGGFTESLAQELSPFGVKACALEPGGMRTNWGARANQDTPELLPEYEPSVGAIAKALKSYWGKEVSDPVKVAQVVLRLAASDRLPAHLLIGSDAVRFAAEAEKDARSRGRAVAGGELVNRRRPVHGIARDAVLRSPCVMPHAKQNRTERRSPVALRLCSPLPEPANKVEMHAKRLGSCLLDTWTLRSFEDPKLSRERGQPCV
jgi:hypothetical protein